MKPNPRINKISSINHCYHHYAYGDCRQMAKVLLVEDDDAAAFVVKEHLEREGHSVDVASNARDALAFIGTYAYSIILLDWHLQFNSSGIDVLKEYRAKGGVAPIMMLTSRGSIQDKEIGFGAGADDYLQKPFLGKELVLRVEALLRRSPAIPNNLIQIGKLKLDTVKRTVQTDEQELSLRPREFALLEHLMRHPGYVFSLEALMNSVWPSDEDPTELAVRLTIKRLRQKIGDATSEDPIETVHGMGYKFKVN